MSGIVPNPEQVEAIEATTERAVRVLAGAGTGKTQVISQRYVYLLRTHPEWRPENILVLTFSEKAATEMRARILRAVGESDLGLTRLDLAGAAISTFHSFGARLLREHSLYAGIAAEAGVLTELEAAEHMERLQEEFLEQGFAGAYGAWDPLSANVYAWEDGKPFQIAREVVAQLLNQAVANGDFHSKHASTHLTSAHARTLAPLIGWLHGRYLELLEEEGLLDFDRLIVGAANLLQENAALCEAIRGEFKAILVDEYQDTNFAQDQLLKALATPDLADTLVVGDPRQAIYVWREARVENLAQFPGDLTRRVDRALIENYRSLPPILTAANRAIAEYDFGDPAEFPADAILKATKGNQQFDGNVVRLQALPTREEEAEAVARWIRQAVEEDGWTYGDIAVLIRARTYLQMYTEALDAAQIPYELAAGDAFYSRPEILDAVHLLRVCLDPTNDLSLIRVLVSPFVGLTQAEAAARLKQRGKPLWVTLTEKSETVPPEVRARLDRFTNLYAAAQRERWTRSAAGMMDWLLETSGLMKVREAAGRRALSKLLAIVHTYDAQHPAGTLGDVCEHLITLLESEQPEKAPELNTSTNAVRIMTVHASKGLEFPVVLVIDNRQRVKPNKDKAPFHDPLTGLVIPELDENDSRFLERMRRQRNEARCLWYVSLTHAKKRLIVTATNDNELENGTYDKTSTLFEELWNSFAENEAEGIEVGATPPALTGVIGGAKAENETKPKPTAMIWNVPVYGKPQVRVSPTAFLLYQRCPAAFRFLSLDRMEELGWDEQEGAGYGESAELGTLFHRLAAETSMGNPAALEELLRDEASAMEFEISPKQSATVRGWIEALRKHPIGQATLAPTQVEVGLRGTFEFSDAAVLVNGFADHVEPTRIVDFKTDAKVDGLVERYGDQVRLYAMMARRNGLVSEDAELLLYHVPTNTALPVSCTPDDEERLFGKLEAFAHAVLKRDGVFEARASSDCRWCPAHEVVCRAGQEWMKANASV